MAPLLFRLLVLVLLLGPAASPAAEPAASVTLRVALYPYVPDRLGLFARLEAAFEAAHPGVNVELVDSYRDPDSGTTVSLADRYYKDGLLKVAADVYEVDTVLLDRMVRAKKLAAIEPPRRAFLPGTIEAVMMDGVQWGVPHWVCGNFLFYRKGDAALARANTWEQLGAAFGEDEALLLDLKGSSTLGEWYLTALAAADGTPDRVVKAVQGKDLDPGAVAALASLLRRCPAGFCRSDALHERFGAYARLFARGKARAYIGYSETLYAALQELSGSCRPGDGCLAADEIDVRALPVNRPGGRQVGWVDALALAAGLDGPKRRLAAEFIELLTSWEGYRLLLDPAGAEVPRYLLPALPLSDTNLELRAPLYPALFQALGSRVFLTAEGLNEALRLRGKALNCALPAERDDEEWQRACGAGAVK